METNSFDRVVPLSELDGYGVAHDDPDIRGWEVYSQDGRKIGSVDQLLVDRDAMKVSHMDVDVDEQLVARRDHHVLIPIAYARLDDERHSVRVEGLASTEVAALPAYAHGRTTADFHTEMKRRFAATPASAGGREARIVRSEEQLAVGKRRTEAGEVEVRKRVETEHVNVPVNLAHDEVTVERRPITDRTMATGARIEGDEIHVPLMKEEAVVEKRVVPQEELVVRKREVVEHETVEADLRKERIDVDRDARTHDR